VSRTSNRIRSTAWLVAVLVVGLSASSANAEVPTMTPQTPTLIGGQVIGPGHVAIGASAGYPGLRGEFTFGLGSAFDISIQPTLTYANGWLSGLNQGLGVAVDVPFRFTLATMPRAALALRVIPYARIGRAAPSWGTGGTIDVRASIPLRRLFSIVVGGASRGGFGSFHYDGCTAGSGYDCNDNYFEGSTYAIIGLETFFHDRWYFFAEQDIGASYTSHGGYYYGGGIGGVCYDSLGNPYACGGRAHAMFNAHAGFAYQFH